jgi:hypothetical protein
MNEMTSPYTEQRTIETDNAVVTTGGSNGMAVAALVCGIVGLFVLQIVLGPLAVIFGGIGLHHANRGARHRGMAWAGLILGIVDVLAIIVILAAAPHHMFYWHVGS